MELDGRHYGRYRLDEDALETWRQHSCLPKLSPSQREATYAAVRPFFEAAARNLIQHHSWRELESSTDVLLSIQSPISGAIFTLPVTYHSLFEHARPCERMLESVFQVLQDADGGQLYVAEPLTDIFHLLQLLAPGCLALVKAEYSTHEVDDEGDVAWIMWRTFSRALPPPLWMNLHARESPELIEIFGASRWAALRRAAADTEVLTSADTTFG